MSKPQPGIGEEPSPAEPCQIPLDDGTVYSTRKGFCPFAGHSLEEYAPIIGEEETRALEALAGELKGIKILELNSTAVGGGVAEMLQNSVPFLNHLGIEDEWKVTRGSESYFEVTKSIHNLLQGKGGCFTPDMEDIYFSTLMENVDANIIDWDPDVVLIHDPQPLGLVPYLKREGETWFWRCHIDIEDTLTEGSPLWEFIALWVRNYDAIIVSAAHYVVSRWPAYTFIIPPFIDPLADKNRELEPEEIDAVMKKYEIDTRLPILAQIGRFDPWKGIGMTIDTYRLVKKKEPCQLILAGGAATDDPEGGRVLSEVCEQTEDDPDIRVLNLPPMSDLEINAIQRASTVIMQASIKEGFGLTVTEALFKGKPVIARPVGGIPMQIRDGENGYFCDTARQSAERVAFLLRHPPAAEMIGARGKGYVEEHFMLPSRVADHLRAIGNVKYGKRYPESITSYHPWYKMSRRRGHSV
jgi:trehalose synthase